MDIRNEASMMHSALPIFFQPMRKVDKFVKPYVGLIIGRMRSSSFQLISIMLYVSQDFYLHRYQ